MPFLRVIRDKRGYETTYLMHWYRDGSRQRSRILYVFRTPSGVRVGRDPLAPDVRRQIEARHPEIAFDWDVVRDNQQVVEPLLETRRRRPRREEGEMPSAPPAAMPAPAPVPAPAPAPAEKPAPVVPPRPAIPSAIQGATLDEQTAFLAEWYPLVRERIVSRVHDVERREALLLLAERLNATSWIDADQITTGLQHAAESLERLSRALSKRRRRPRRRPAGASGDSSASPDTVTVNEEGDGQADDPADDPADTESPESPPSDR